MNVKKIMGCLALAILTSGYCFSAGCTPESPPLPAQSIPAESTSAVSDITSAESVTEKSTDTEEQTPSVSSEESIAVPDFVVWDDAKGDLVEICYRQAGDIDDVDYYRTDDAALLEKLTAALKGLKPVKESTERKPEDTLILLYTAKNRSGRLTFEHGSLVKDGKRYELEGYETLKQVLKEIADNYPAWKEKYEEWIHRMSAAQDRIKELTTSDEYQAASVEQRHTMAMDLLRQLESNDLIKPGSIYDDGGENISFTFNCDESGVSGAIMLREFDPNFN